MSDTGNDAFLLLAEAEMPPAWKGALPGGCRFGFARFGDGRTLGQCFLWDGGEGVPPDYVASARQRHALLEGVKWRHATRAAHLAETEEGGLALFLAMPDGEPLVDYLSRRPDLPDEHVDRIASGVLEWLEPLAAAPRLLANIRLEDFVVELRDGVELSVSPCLALGLLREEKPLSDYQIARQWTESFARLHAHARSSKKAPLEKIAPHESRPFRPLLKSLETGRDRSLEDRFREIGTLLRRSDGPCPVGAKADFANDVPGNRPVGLLAEFLRQRAAARHPEKLGMAEADSAAPTRFSAYLAEAAPTAEGEARLAYLLPPEQWFEESLVDGVNRRLSHPFLRAHHNGTRIRAVYCEEDFTLLLADSSTGLPLPSLLAARDGLAPDEALLVAGKLHRALAQFESAGCSLALSTPWQVELHPEREVVSPGWGALLRQGIESWPPWEIKLRMERPTESLLAGAGEDAWNEVSRKCGGKFFPSLVAWAHDWRRFRWAADRGSLAGEPLSWDARFEALFKAARDHLDPADAGQRGKFLALVEEGCALAGTGRA